MYLFSDNFIFFLQLSNYSCPYVHGDRVTHWNKEGLQESVSLQKNSKNTQLPPPPAPFTADGSRLGVEFHSALSRPCWDGDWIDLVRVLCRQPQLLWAHGCSGPVTSRGLSLSHCPVFPGLWLLWFFYSWALWEGTGKDVPLGAEPSVDTHTLSLAVPSLCFNCYPMR